MPHTRPAAVAGLFYPQQPAALQAAVRACLADAADDERGPPPKLIVVPHAGFPYSGPVAAHAYARLRGRAAAIRRVVLVGPTHRAALRGIAAPSSAQFETPLGAVPLDRAALDALADLPQVVYDDRVHAQEHALEVQLPFLQTVLAPGFSLLPLAVGEVGTDAVAEVLERLWGGDETLIVVSTDLSHYHRYDDACALDAQTVARITHGATDLLPAEACGAGPLNGAIRAARRHGLAAELLDLRNSGDTAGDRSRVVGYAAIAFAPAPAAGSAIDDDGALADALLGGARHAIADALGIGQAPGPAHPALRQSGACFVTLHDAAGRLRGCIGSLAPHRPLGEDLVENARAAAFRDPRFAPLSAGEWGGLRLEVSLLGPIEWLDGVTDAASAAARLRPQVDGAVLEGAGHRATLLPQVWAQLPDPARFVDALLGKAGLRAWQPGLRLGRFAVRVFEEPAA